MYKGINDKIIIFTSEKGWRDVTDEIRFINDYQTYFMITFKSGKKYPFSYKNVVRLRDAKKIDDIDPFLFGEYLGRKESYLYANGFAFFVLDENYGVETIDESLIEKYKGFASRRQNTYNYFSSLAKLYDKELEGDFLSTQYENIKDKWNNPQTVLGQILNKKTILARTKKIIYPFPYNASQLKGIKAGMTSSVSIIQGPPGTGKTQTILNLIANIVAQGMNVAVISNNNLAVQNVYEKMEESGYGFLCANLGNLENRDLFFSKEHKKKKLLTSKIINDLDSLVELENQYFEKESKLSLLLEKRDTFAKEYEKFIFGNDNKIIKIRKNIAPDKILKLAVELENKGKEKIGFIKKICITMIYGIPFSELNCSASELTEILMRSYANKKMQSLDIKIREAQKFIKNYKAKNVSNTILELSRNKFNEAVNKLMIAARDEEFTTEDFKGKFDDFIKRYPVILSSTFCLPTTVPNRFSFDYLIIDEASQSTLTTVLPSLAKGRHIVIIGDDKQLPPVVPEEIIELESNIYSQNNVDSKMRDNGQSFLSFVDNYLQKIPKTLLKEHYRCHKQIINFSNMRIYGNQLELKKQDDGSNHLVLLKTVPGNHARRNDTGGSGQYNQREIDEIIGIVNNIPKEKTIGVITPYRRQAELLAEALPSNIEVGTIHTFQGREEQYIIFSTVANDIEDFKRGDETIKSFVNNEQLINVAVTRAKEQFILVTSDKIAHSNYGILSDLVKYITYQTNSDLGEGTIKSVFDILYDDYARIRKTVLNTTEIVTEELIKNLIYKIVSKPKYSSLSFSCHVSLKSIFDIKEEKYNADEYKYLHHPWTHLDFIVYNKYDKKPILAIEVDGISFHEQNKKQTSHDLIKNKCLEDFGLPLLRLKTNGSNEENVITCKINEILNLD